MMAARAVEVNTAPPGMPSKAQNMLGFTARMYDMVRNVVIPAIISLRIVVCDGSKPKSLCNISNSLGFRAWVVLMFSSQLASL